MISIIIPCSGEYSKTYLPGCLDSLDDQVGDNEIIVEKFIPAEENFSDVLNRAIEKAKGEFIIVLGADDYLYPCLSKLEEAIDDSDIYYGKQAMFGSEEWVYTPKKNLTLKDFSEDNQIAISSMFRKSKWKEVGGYHNFGKAFPEDWDFWARMVQAGAKLKYVDTVILEYRVHKEQAWDKMQNNVAEYRKVINERLCQRFQ